MKEWMVAGWQHLLSNLATSAMWPVVVLTVALIFRRSLEAAIGRIKGAEVFGNKVEFRESVEKLDQVADRVKFGQSEKISESLESEMIGEHEELEVSASVRTDQSEKKLSGQESGASEQKGELRASTTSLPDSSAARLRHLAKISHISPAAAIVGSWSDVEECLLSCWREVQEANDLPKLRNSSPLGIIGALGDRRLLSPDEIDLLVNLLSTRNQVAHNKIEPSEGQSLAYVEAAATAIGSLIESTLRAEQERLKI